MPVTTRGTFRKDPTTIIRDERGTPMAAKASEPIYEIVEEKHLAMRTRDGVTLYADVYRPDAPGKFPALVIRTPYNKRREPPPNEPPYFVPRGYVVIFQDMRGRFSSEGDGAGVGPGYLLRGLRLPARRLRVGVDACLLRVYGARHIGAQRRL